MNRIFRSRRGVRVRGVPGERSRAKGGTGRGRARARKKSARVRTHTYTRQNRNKSEKYLALHAHMVYTVRSWRAKQDDRVLLHDPEHQSTHTRRVRVGICAAA